MSEAKPDRGPSIKQPALAQAVLQMVEIGRMLEGLVPSVVQQ
jgi:hypothetical protein